MDFKKSFKKRIIRNQMEKRKATQNFDEIKSELHTLPTDADDTFNNSHYFASHDLDKNAFFLRLGERGGKNPVAEVWFGFVSANGSAYMNSESLYRLDQSPVKVECVTPLREWKFAFKGKMVPVKPDKELIATPCGEAVTVEFNGIFTSEIGLFEFSRDTNTNSYVEAIASEKWVKGFSEELKQNHQTRIEQIGRVICQFKTANEVYAIDADAIRDQAYGRRLWSYMNHYSWLYGSLADGRAFDTVMVLYPTINVYGIRTGYVLAGGEYQNLLEVDYPKAFATTGVAPRSGTVMAKFSDGMEATIEFATKIIFPFQFTDVNGGYNVFEGVTTFTFNGVKGAGIAEFSYNQDKQRYEQAFTHTLHGRLM